MHIVSVYFIAILLFVRTLLNLFDPSMLGMLFVLLNGTLLVLLIYARRFFSIPFIIFMMGDSMIGTFLATRADTFDVLFWGVVALNALAVVIVLINPRNIFTR